ncbi:fungal-specific transcription factor domain-containing protein [Bisporella sp. PMI_857]|nr:fungal-specific transcription factor domain-containing protein [Bisporella sp. PMI_857]
MYKKVFALPETRLQTPISPSCEISQEPEETRFDGHYIGPTSAIAFLYRAQRRFQQDSATKSGNPSSSSQASIFSFGDGYQANYSVSELKYPEKEQGNALLARYFDFAMPTYRFLHRQTTELLLDRFYDETQIVSNNHKQPLSCAEAAICLLVLATASLYGKEVDVLTDKEYADETVLSGQLFAAAEVRLSSETGRVRLESVQAKLALCIYLLASSRINQAWYTFGTTSQMIMALGLHRKRYTQSFSASTSSIEIEIRKRVFWSAYTLDKYLSVILGRPRIFRDEDIDQHLPERLNNNDLSTAGYTELFKPSKTLSVSDAPVFHARLAKIVGSISSDLYPTNKDVATPWTEIAQQRTSELKAWKESLPAFLEPDKVDPSMLIPIYQRQSTVLRLAYLHALILANRPLLLDRFVNLSRPSQYPGNLVGGLKECIDAAVAVVETVNGLLDQGRMRKPFWFTHYISFCAISALYVYTIQSSGQSSGQEQHDASLQYFEAADRCQRAIYATTASTSPFRRYNIILDELKKEVIRLTSQGQDSGSFASGRQLEVQPPQSADLAESRGLPNQALDMRDRYSIEYMPLAQDLQPSAYGHNDATMQIFDQAYLSYGQEVELGWAEFDSCVSLYPVEIFIIEQ